MPAVSEAIYRLTDSGYYDENNPYNGKIDLILQDVTEIMEWEFYTAFALNSITLPKVTTIGDQAFQGCYYLKRITFGSVVTSIVQENGVTFVVGDKVDGCDLVLNCGQLEAERYIQTRSRKQRVVQTELGWQCNMEEHHSDPHR